MKQDRIFPDDYTYGFGGPAPKAEAAPLWSPPPIMVGDSGVTLFDAKRWCIEQVVIVRSETPPPFNLRLDEEAAALLAFLYDPAPA